MLQFILQANEFVPLKFIMFQGSLSETGPMHQTYLSA